jgi:hypothetical protein
LISTVTTTTITTIAIALSAGTSLGALATILLISLLGTQEVVSFDSRESLKVLSSHLNVSILPLLVVFTLIIAIKITQLWS